MKEKRITKCDIILAGNGGAPDECWNWEYCKYRNGYGQVRMNGRMRLVHRVSYEVHRGTIPDGMQIDHKCSNRSCWNPDHLRVVTQAQNLQHRPRNIANTSGYRGVYFAKDRNKWHAHVKHQGRTLHLGYFDTAKEAAAVAEVKRRELGFLGT